MNHGEHPDLPEPIRLRTRGDQQRHELLWIAGATVAAVLFALLVAWLAAPSDGRPPAAPTETFTTTTTTATVTYTHATACPPEPSQDY